MGKGWFVTGSSRGLGRVWVEAALERGDRVVATARDAAALDGLVEAYGDRVLALPLDVTDRDAAFRTVAEAKEFLGSLDVVVNNAGYGLFGMVEEITEEQARAQLETNVFGALWVTQAAVAIMREQGSGHIVQVSSIGGVHAFPGLGLYHASKWALEGLSQSLAQEVAGFGIHVTLIEPGGFDTDWSGPSSTISQALPDYAELHQQVAEVRKQRWAKPGDPKASAAALLKVVDAERPPLRVFFGETPLQTARADYESRLANWEQWQPVAVQAQG